MKKITSLLIPSVLIAMLFVSFTSCKKDKDQSSITVASLAKYHVSVLIKSPVKAETRLVLFSNADNKTTAQLVGIDFDQAQTVTLSNNTLTLQETSGDKATFTFMLKEDNNGEITLTDVKYTNTTDPNMKVQAYYITKIEGVYPIKATGYSGVTSGSLYFGANTWGYSGSTRPGTYSLISQGAWKGDLDGRSFMGVVFKENNRQYMILQTAKQRYDIYYLV